MLECARNTQQVLKECWKEVVLTKAVKGQVSQSDICMPERNNIAKMKWMRTITGANYYLHLFDGTSTSRKQVISGEATSIIHASAHSIEHMCTKNAFVVLFCTGS